MPKKGTKAWREEARANDTIIVLFTLRDIALIVLYAPLVAATLLRRAVVGSE